MAPDLRAVSITIYNKSGSIALSIPSGDFYDDNTVGEVLEDSRVVALGITELSTTQGGTAESHSNSLHNYTQSGTELNIVFYDVTPTPSTLTSHGHIDTLHMRHVQHGESYSAMSGPCSEGYHIPSSTEWNGVYNALVSLGISSVVNFSTYLKLPLAGARGGTNAVLNSRGTRGYYWCCNIYQNNTGNAVVLSTETGEINIYGAYMYGGSNIRAFKDEVVIPTSSRTKLYGTSIAEGGIFYNSSLGLISISSNGATWYTIRDKNEGATAVYNYGNTLTESNCGKFFQWGNNYAFSGDQNYDVSSITKSSTKVDITNYGPDNYYNSSTWITVNPWWTGDSNIAYNLRGGSTGVIPAEDYREPVYYGPTHTLKSWEELIAYTDIDTLITELNKAPEEYYNKLTEENKLYTCASTIYYFCSTGGWVFVGGYLPGYDIRTKTWAKGPTSEPCPS